MSCKDCFSGDVRSGTPTGSIKTVHGLRTYIAKPPEGQSPMGTIVIIPDAFGLPFVNNQLLADHYASAGEFTVYLPDFMNGGEAPLSMMRNMALLAETSWLWTPYYTIAMLTDLLPHLWRNRMGVCWPRMIDWFSALRAETSMPIGAAGFCWGGLHVIMLAQDRADVKTTSGSPLVDACFAAHPSNVSMPSDFERVIRPLSIAVGDEDTLISVAQAKQAQSILGKLPDGKGELKLYPGARHGFSVRASRSTPDAKETIQAEEAEEQAVFWFKKHFVS
ncbi:hypothetical protein OPT61_g6329 [Boeremia exigua]|uniref:Uncharacterized protein n=1 Tax=Boeremia exigua TaxID=749465 RepID=A0ACC2I760_9PLEO|nr:hypothetical protein OPT61_g6329 [Boeremia exigua]